MKIDPFSGVFLHDADSKLIGIYFIAQRGLRFTVVVVQSCSLRVIGEKLPNFSLNLLNRTFRAQQRRLTSAVDDIHGWIFCIERSLSETANKFYMFIMVFQFGRIGS